MNLKELHSFKMSDAIALHDELNPRLFDGDKMDPLVRDRLLEIAEDFIEHLGIDNFDVDDVTMSGSSAAYSYTPHSDIDLHITTDLSKYPDNDVYRELFDAKKNVYNETHNIKIGPYDVELYVQDTAQPHVSLGDYSVLRDEWNKHPVKRRENLDTDATKLKFEKLAKLAVRALRSKDLEKVENVITTIKKYRKAGLDEHGEFGPENLAFKALRTQGLIKKLFDLRNKLHADAFSLAETKNKMTDEDYDPNGPPPGPEFKPTMPAGTVKVDVSDVYDWYKLGQHISNLKGLGKHDFGQGPPSTIFSFGSEDQEHKYIKDLEKTGLTTTDIDPVDPKQPKGMKRQKVDPTYNVNEASGYIPSNSQRNDPRFKTALTVDVKPDSIQKNAKKLGSKISRAGIPPLLRP
jgi:hypothetical protein